MPYGEVHQYSTAGATVAFTTAGTTANRSWTTFAGWTTANIQSDGQEFAYGASAESLICGSEGTGLYACKWDAQVSHQTTGLNLKIGVCRNGSALTNFQTKVPMQASTALRHTVGGNGLLRLTNPDDALSIRIFQDATVASTANVWNANLSVYRISTVSSSLDGKFV